MSAVLELASTVDQDARPAVPFVPGMTTDLSHEDYLRVEALSASGIKRILQSPMHYDFDRTQPRTETESMLVGTALHMAVLEPARFATSYAVAPDDAPRRPTAAQLNAKSPSATTVEAVRYWAKFDQETEGKTLLTAEQAARVEGMARAIRRHPAHDEFLCDGAPEVSLMWEDARLRIPCKARFDYLRPDGIAIDLKSCQDASLDGFARAVATFRYHYQHAWYNNGHEHVNGRSLKAFLFFAVESVAPFGCAVYVLPSNAVLFGNDRCEEAMLLYAQARKTGYWRGYSEKIQPLALPRWATTITPIV